MKSIALGVGFAVMLVVPAFSQTNSANQNSSPPATGSISPQDQTTSSNVRQQVQQNLSKAGYTDIKVLPESFLVGATDPNGNPVMMIIKPDSVAAVTYPSGNTNSSDGTANSTSGSRSN